VQPLTGAESNHLTVPDLDPRPDGRWSSANWKRDQDDVRGYRDKGDPWLFFLYGRQPPAVEPKLGHPRPELAAAGNQQPGDPVAA
jgi:hypothetical protein